MRSLRDAAAMLNTGKDQLVVLQSIEASEATYARWLKQIGGIKSEAAKRLEEAELQNKRLKQIDADPALDIQRLKPISEENWQALLVHDSL